MYLSTEFLYSDRTKQVIDGCLVPEIPTLLQYLPQCIIEDESMEYRRQHNVERGGWAILGLSLYARAWSPHMCHNSSPGWDEYILSVLSICSPHLVAGE